MPIRTPSVPLFALFALAGCYPAGNTAPARSQEAASRVGTWQLVPIPDGGVWKINTETGETRRCLDGMLEKACVLTTDVASVAELKENAAPPAIDPTPIEDAVPGATPSPAARAPVAAPVSTP